MKKRARPERTPPPPPPARSSQGAITLDGPARPLMTVRELADYLQISKKQLGRLVRREVIPVVRLGASYRFDLSAVRRKLDGAD